MAIPPETKNVPNYKNIKVSRIGKLKNRLWEHIFFPLYVKKHKAISLNLCNVAPLISPGIVCIHDVKVKAHPEFFNTKFRLWYRLLFYNATKRAKKIITVSNFSKKEIIKYYDVAEEKIVVIPNAWQHYQLINFDEEALKKYDLVKNEYYFAMGSLEPNKNFKWIAEVARKNPDHIFAIAGSINEKIFAKGLGFKCPPNMKLLGFVSDEEAKTLMRDCQAFLFPSIYEGFGLPPLEALSAGCRRIVVSDTEVMHEIYGNSAYYINPGELQPSLGELLNGQIVDTNKPLEKYSWGKSAWSLYSLLKNYNSKLLR
ncbi:MAG: glycosyltransferase family 1 protein [Synergistaceae bacterium]|nr:glycosyltransferase family 1 protein [Synergistaceae bacterium]